VGRKAKELLGERKAKMILEHKQRGNLMTKRKEKGKWIINRLKNRC